MRFWIWIIVTAFSFVCPDGQAAGDPVPPTDVTPYDLRRYECELFLGTYSQADYERESRDFWDVYRTTGVFPEVSDAFRAFESQLHLRNQDSAPAADVPKVRQELSTHGILEIRPLIRRYPFSEAAHFWRLISRAPDHSAAGSRMRLQFRNTLRRTHVEISVPWDHQRAARFAYLMHFQLPGEGRLSDPRVGLADEVPRSAGGPTLADVNALISERDQLSRVRTSELFNSLAYDLLIHEGASIEATEPEFFQSVLQATEVNDEVLRVLHGEPVRLAYPLLRGWNAPWSDRLMWDEPGTTVKRSVGQIQVEIGGQLPATARQTQRSLDLFFMELYADSFTDPGDIRTRTLRQDRSRVHAPSHSLYARSLRLRTPDREINLHYFSPEKMRAEIALNRAMRSLSPGRIPVLEIAPAYRHAPADVRAYVRAAYAKRLNISHESLRQLMKISQRMEARTEYLLLSRNPIEGGINRAEQMRLPRTRNSEASHFEILGAISIVESRSADEQLPLENFSGYRISRTTGKPIIELGRFSVDPRYRPQLMDQILRTAFFLAASRDVEKIVAECEASYAKRLMADHGFRKVHERLNFEGKPEYILEITPEELFARPLSGIPNHTPYRK